jgi:hypothetical protein
VFLERAAIFASFTAERAGIGRDVTSVPSSDVRGNGRRIQKAFAAQHAAMRLIPRVRFNVCQEVALPREVLTTHLAHVVRHTAVWLKLDVDSVPKITSLS